MWMMGSALNSASSAAREMDMVLKSEIAAHSAYDSNTKPNLTGVPLPGRKQVMINYLIKAELVRKLWGLMDRKLFVGTCNFD